MRKEKKGCIWPKPSHHHALRDIGFTQSFALQLCAYSFLCASPAYNVWNTYGVSKSVPPWFRCWCNCLFLISQVCFPNKRKVFLWVCTLISLLYQHESSNYRDANSFYDHLEQDLFHGSAFSSAQSMPSPTQLQSEVNGLTDRVASLQSEKWRLEEKVWAGLLSASITIMMFSWYDISPLPIKYLFFLLDLLEHLFGVFKPVPPGRPMWQEDYYITLHPKGWEGWFFY